MSTMNELRRDLASIFNLIIEEKATAEMTEALLSLRPVIQSGNINDILKEFNAIITINTTNSVTDLILEMRGILEAYIKRVKRTPDMCRYCLKQKLRAGVGLCKEHFDESYRFKQERCTVM